MNAPFELNHSIFRLLLTVLVLAFPTAFHKALQYGHGGFGLIEKSQYTYQKFCKRLLGRLEQGCDIAREKDSNRIWDRIHFANMIGGLV